MGRDTILIKSQTSVGLAFNLLAPSIMRYTLKTEKSYGVSKIYFINISNFSQLRRTDESQSVVHWFPVSLTTDLIPLYLDDLQPSYEEQ